MARTVSKSLASATIYVLNPAEEFNVDENGMPIANVVFSVEGNPSQNKARILAEKYCESRNIMVLNIDVDESKLSVAPDVFIANSDICEEGKSYGREYVTQTFKITHIDGFYMDTDKGIQRFDVYLEDKTTDSKMLKFVREQYGNTACITSSVVIDERRFMTRERYLELAR